MSEQITIKKPFNIGGTVLIISVLTIVAKIAGFAEKKVLAHFFGTEAFADIYFAVIGLMMSGVFLVKELIHPTFLPVFVKATKSGPHDSQKLFKQIFFLCLFVFSVVGIAIALFPTQLVHVFMPGFSIEKKELSATILRYLFPSCIFLCLSMLMYTTLHARRKFFKVAVSEAAYKIFVLIGFVFLIPLLHINAIPLVLFVGSLMLFLVMLALIPESKTLFQNCQKGPSELSRVFLLMGPIAIGVVFSHISGLVDNMLASTLPTGKLSYLGYSKKIIDTILLIGPVSLVMVTYPLLTNLSQKSIEDYTHLFAKVLRILVYVAIPGTILIVILTQPVVRVIFGGGKFGTESIIGTSKGLLIYGFGFLAFALEAHIVYSFYAFSDTKTPVVAGILCVIIDIILAVSMIKVIGYLGIALAFVISKTIKVFSLGCILERKLCFLRVSGFLPFLLKTVAASVPSTLLLLYLCRFQSSKSFLNTAAIDLVLPTVGFSVVFIVFSVILKIEEAGQLKEIILRRVGIAKVLS